MPLLAQSKAYFELSFFILAFPTLETILGAYGAITNDKVSPTRLPEPDFDTVINSLTALREGDVTNEDLKRNIRTCENYANQIDMINKTLNSYKTENERSSATKGIDLSRISLFSKK